MRYLMIVLYVMFITLSQSCGYLHPPFQQGHNPRGNRPMGFQDFLKQKNQSLRVSDVTYSPDGSIIAISSNDWKSGIADARIRLCSSETGKQIKVIKGHTRGISEIDFSPDGKLLASASGDNTIKIWSVDSGKEIRTLKGHLESVQYRGFNRDGSIIVGATDTLRNLKLFDAQTREPICTISGDQRSGRTGQFHRFSTDGTVIINKGSTSDVTLCSAKTGEVLHQFHVCPSSVKCADLSPDNKILAAGSSTTRLYLLDVQSGKVTHEIMTNKRYSGNLNFVTFSPDGKIIAVDGLESDVKLWSMENEEFFHTFNNSDSVASLAFSGDSQTLAVGTHNGSVNLWSVETGDILNSFDCSPKKIASIAFNPSSETLAYGTWNEIGLISTETGDKIFVNESRGGDIDSIAFSENGKRITSKEGGEIVVYSSETGQKIDMFEIVHAGIHDVEFSPDGGFIASAAGDKTVRLWSVKTGEMIHTFPPLSYRCETITFSPDGNMLASKDLDSIKVWNINTLELIRELKGTMYTTKCLVFNPDSLLITANAKDSKIAVIWSVEKGQKIHSMDCYSGSITGLDFSPDGKILATGVNAPGNAIKFWDVETGVFIKNILSPDDPIVTIEYSPDGKSIAAASTNHAIIWSTDTGKRIRKIKAR